MKTETLKIVIIDDHKIVRQGLKELIENLGNYKVIDEYENGVNFLNNLENIKDIPDVFILDYSMPMKNGLEVLQEALKLNKDLKFLLLTQNFDESIINKAYNFGARGFLHKTCTANQLKFAIDNIATVGYTNITEILKRTKNLSVNTEENESINISKREFIFLEYVCDPKEYTYNEIATLMCISVKTVDSYRASLFDKLKVKSKVGLVLFSFKNKLTKPFNI